MRIPSNPARRMYVKSPSRSPARIASKYDTKSRNRGVRPTVNCAAAVPRTGVGDGGCACTAQRENRAKAGGSNLVRWMDLSMVRVAGLVGLLAIVCPLRLWAQAPLAPTIDANEPAAEYKRDKTLHAYRITAGPPRVDGVLDDETWSLAEAAEGLVQWDPDNGEPMTERTRFQVAYDARFIYVAVRCDD